MTTMQYIHTSVQGELLPESGSRPQPGPGQVLIRVKAAGVNRLDLLQRKGHYPPPPGVTDILGVEVAGTIEQSSPDYPYLRVGDQVCALLQGGGYAEYVVADASLCLPVPGGMDPVSAAALPEACFTVWCNVFDIAGLRTGEQILIHGGASGIGTMAIQMAAAAGAIVHVTAGTDEKCRQCLALGATTAINYRNEDFVERGLEATGGHGMDVILDMVGGDYAARNVHLAAMDGRIVMIATQKGVRAELNILEIMQKRVILTGSTLRGRDLAMKTAIADKLRLQVWPLLEAGRIHPVIYQRVPLAEAARAHEIMQSGTHVGKIILTL